MRLALRRSWRLGTAVGTFVALLVWGWAYYIYAPAPAMPHLSAVAVRGEMRVGERIRSYVAYIPARLPPRSPLVLVLHGSFMDGEMMRRGTGYEFDVIADRDRFAVVYPDGYDQNWNDCRRTDAYPAKSLNIDDMGFMRAIIARLRSEHDIDPARVFAMGYSDGGEMVYRLAIEAPEEIAAVTAVEANLPAPSDFICNNTNKTSRVMIVSGTDDPIMPFEGGEITLFGFGHRGLMRSAPATAEYFVMANGLTEPPQTTRLPRAGPTDPTSVERSVWSRDGMPIVAFDRINGGGHVVPQPAYRWPRILGPTSPDLNAPKASWHFFAAGSQLR